MNKWLSGAKTLAVKEKGHSTANIIFAEKGSEIPPAFILLVYLFSPISTPQRSRSLRAITQTNATFFFKIRVNITEGAGKQETVKDRVIYKLSSRSSVHLARSGAFVGL